MRSIKKFSSYEELQAYEAALIPDASTLQRHEAFKKVMLELKAAQEDVDNLRKLKEDP